MLDFDKSWHEAIGLATALKATVGQIEAEQSDLDVKRELARWLIRFEALAGELAYLREEANRGGGLGGKLSAKGAWKARKPLLIRGTSRTWRGRKPALPGCPKNHKKRGLSHAA